MNIVKLCSQNSYGFHCNRASTGINRSMSLIIQRKSEGITCSIIWVTTKIQFGSVFVKKEKLGIPSWIMGFNTY